MIELKSRLIFAVCFSLILCHYMATVTTKELYNFSVSRIVCEDSDPRIVHNVSCFTRVVNRTTKAHNIIGYLQPNVSFNAIYVELKYYQKAGAVYGRLIGAYDVDFCGYLAGRVFSPLVGMLWPYLKKASNLNDRCPFSKSMYKVTDLIFLDTFLPPALPEGQARLDIHVRNGPQRLSIMKMKFYIEIEPKGAAKLVF